MNEVISAMEERRSMRKYRKDMVACSLVDQIIEAGTYAANGMGYQNTIIIAVTNQKIRDELSAMNCQIGGWKEGFDPFYGAPVVLKEEFETEYGRELLNRLGIEGEWEGIGHCVLGYAEGDAPKAAKRKEKRVYYVE